MQYDNNITRNAVKHAIVKYGMPTDSPFCTAPCNKSVTVNISLVA
jgi:hypothetical protein